MIKTRITLWTAAVFSLLVAIASYRFLFLGLGLSFPELGEQIDKQRLAFIVHISAAPVALAIGTFQFFPGLRKRRPALHRYMGRIYAAAILISGVAGVFLAIGAEGGPVAAAGFGLLSLVWIATTANAIRHAIKRRIGKHRRWMVYSFALTFAGVTLRLYLVGFMVAGFTYTEASVYLAWLCWVPNLAVAYWWLNRKRAS